MRDIILDLLHKGNKDHWPTPPMEDEIDTYLKFGDPEDGPTFDDFRLDFSYDRPISKSVWNKRAAEIIVEQYFRTHSDPDETGVTHPEVEKEFLAHLNRIRREYMEAKKAGPSTPTQRRTSDDAKRQRRAKRVNSVRPIFGLGPGNPNR